jgi:hypothetical protein
MSSSSRRLPPGIMPLPEPGVSFTCSTTRLMTLRAAGGRRAAIAAAEPAAGPAAGAGVVAGFGLAIGARAGALAALRGAALRGAVLRRAAGLRRAFEELFGRLLERFFDAFLDERFFDAFFDDRLPDERFFEDFFGDFFEDFRDERFLEAAIWFLLLHSFEVGRGACKFRWGIESPWQLGCTRSNLDEHVAIVTPVSPSAMDIRHRCCVVRTFRRMQHLPVRPEPARFA